jgi:uncharacterized iron-regulated membrane protein
MSFIDAPRHSTPRRWLFQVHLWLGLILGPVVGVVGLTGAIVVFRYELNRITTPGTAYVAPQGERLTIDELTARVQAARPADKLLQAGWGEAGPDNAWNFRAESPEGHRIHTFINQYTGEITGRDDYHEKWMQWFFDLHAYLLAGDTGMFLNGFVGLAAVILSLTGLVVWWPGAARWLFGFRYLWGAGWKRQNYDLHKIVGFYSSLALAFVSITGVYFSFPSLYKQMAETLTGTTVTVGPPPAATTWSERRVPMEEFIRVAERVQPGTVAISFGFPQQEGAPVIIRTKEARDWHRIGLNYVYLEPADAVVVRNDRFSDVSTATKAILFMYPFHFGRFGGRLGSPLAYHGVMVLYVIIGIAPFALMVTGLLMYWNRSLSKKWRRALLARVARRPVSASNAALPAGATPAPAPFALRSTAARIDRSS